MRLLRSYISFWSINYNSIRIYVIYDNFFGKANAVNVASFVYVFLAWNIYLAYGILSRQMEID